MTNKLVEVAYNALDDKKGINIKVIDISKVSTIADYFIIASGSNKSQVQALSDNVSDAMAKAGVESKQTEGYHSANWILMDYHDIIIHVFDVDSRNFYNIERIWSDGDIIEM